MDFFHLTTDDAGVVGGGFGGFGGGGGGGLATNSSTFGPGVAFEDFTQYPFFAVNATREGVEGDLVRQSVRN